MDSGKKYESRGIMAKQLWGIPKRGFKIIVKHKKNPSCWLGTGATQGRIAGGVVRGASLSDRVGEKAWDSVGWVVWGAGWGGEED